MTWAFGEWWKRRGTSPPPSSSTSHRPSQPLGLVLDVLVAFTPTTTVYVGWIKNANGEAEMVSVQDLDETGSGTFMLQTMKTEFDGKPVGNGYISYTYTAWGAQPSFYSSDKVAGCQVLKQCEQPNKEVNPADWYQNMVDQAKVS